MSNPDELRRLNALFRQLGAREPDSWARSQLEEGIPQLARFLFLRQAWRLVVNEEDPAWIDAYIAQAEAEPDAPYAGGGHALKALRARGATNDEIIDLVRSAQAELLFGFCYLLEDPGDVEPEVASIAWALFQVDEDRRPREPISGLHESVLETDPTGREMRPRRRAG
jgi:hypothetical protein